MPSLLADVEAYCQELRPIEELCYVEHRYNEQTIPLAKKYNLLGMPVPVEYGGRGADAVTYARALARIGREGTGVRTFFSGHTSIGQYPIMRFGNADQNRRYLPASVAGDKILAFGLTEPDAGSNPLGDDHDLSPRRRPLSAERREVSDLQRRHRRRGHRLRLSGRQDRQRAADERLHRRHRGRHVRGEDLHAKPGMFTANTGMFQMTDHPVPVENLLGEEGNGFRIAMGTLVSGSAERGGGLPGRDRRLPGRGARLCQHAHQHGKPIGRHQLVQEHSPRSKWPARQRRARRTAPPRQRRPATQRRPTRNLRGESRLAVAEAKFFASNAAWDAADRAVQVFGGRGWSELYRVGRHLQDVRVCRIYEGTDEILKLKIAAALLGKDFAAFS